VSASEISMLEKRERNLAIERGGGLLISLFKEVFLDTPISNFSPGILKALFPVQRLL